MKQNKSRKKSVIIRTVVLGLVGIVIGFCIYGWNAKNVMGNKMPMPFGIGASIVLSGSMEPELSVDDLVIIKETDSVEVNDIVVFQEGNSLVIHRVIAIDGDTITTKGDKNNTADNPISHDSIKGELVFSIPKVGIVISFLKKPIVIILLLALALFLCERSYRHEKQTDQDELSAIEEEIKKLLEQQNAEINENNNTEEQ